LILRFLLLLAAFAAAVLVGLGFGEVFLSPCEIWQALLGQGQYVDVIREVRLPRLAAAAIVGASLALSGYLMQALSGNGLADPYITGVSSGAGLVTVVAMIAGVDFAFLPVLAFCGGLSSSILGVLLSRTGTGMSVQRLILAGVALSAVCGSMITLVLSLCHTDRTYGIIYWLAGSVNGRTWSEVLPSGAYVACGFCLALVASKPLRLLSLGAGQAGSLGLNVERAQLLILGAAVLLASTAVSLSGLVGFVGLVAPYFARMLFGSDERAHLASTAILGAALVVISDLITRLLPGQELPLGTLLALLGGPFFIFLVTRQGALQTDAA